MSLWLWLIDYDYGWSQWLVIGLCLCDFELGQRQRQYPCCHGSCLWHTWHCTYCSGSSSLFHHLPNQLPCPGFSWNLEVGTTPWKQRCGPCLGFDAQCAFCTMEGTRSRRVSSLSFAWPPVLACVKASILDRFLMWVHIPLTAYCTVAS